jgi:CBS domain-containing protein
MVVIEDLCLVERSEWETKTVESIVRPLTEIPTVTESANLAEVINKLEDERLPYITVVSPAGAVAGVIDRGDIVQAVAQTLGLRMTDADIKRIKQQGSYPPGLQLQVIAKSTQN